MHAIEAALRKSDRPAAALDRPYLHRHR